MIIFRKICSESAGVDVEVYDEWNDKLAQHTEEYEPEDIFNVEKSRYFHQYLPDKNHS